jgi:integrase
MTSWTPNADHVAAASPRTSIARSPPGTRASYHIPSGDGPATGRIRPRWITSRAHTWALVGQWPSANAFRSPRRRRWREPEQRQFLRAAQKCGSVRDTAIALLLLLYTGLRVEKVHHLDLADVPISARRGKVIVRAGKGEHGGIYREVPMHHAAREALRAWLHERANHRGAATPALFLNRLGGRLLARSIRTIIAELGPGAGLVHDAGPDAGKSRVHPTPCAIPWPPNSCATGWTS